MTEFDPQEIQKLSNQFPDDYWTDLPIENGAVSMLLDINQEHSLALIPHATIRDAGKSIDYYFFFEKKINVK